MYFVSQFYSHEAWQQWRDRRRVDLRARRHTSDYADLEGGRAAWRTSVLFEQIDTFAELVERVAFLQVMNKRHVLYFRGSAQDYSKDTEHPGLDLPSMLRAPPGGRITIELLRQRWNDLEDQAKAWEPLLRDHHPRHRTLTHYPETSWAVQQHYKDLLPKHDDPSDDRRAQSLYLDVTHSVRIAAAFALAGRTQDGELAYVAVVALPQTTGSITFDADEQLQLMRLSALCPPNALRPQLQEGFLVGRFPRPPLTELNVGNVITLEEFHSLRRRTVAIIPLRVNGQFWGRYGALESDALLRCPWFESLPKPSWNNGALKFDR
jgi:hypothetical protein